MSATTTQLLSSGQFCKLRYDTIPVKVHLQTFLSIPITQKCQILSCDTLVANELYVLLDDGPFRPKHVTRKFPTSITNILSCGRRCLLLYYWTIFIIIIIIIITTVWIKSTSQIFVGGFPRCLRGFRTIRDSQFRGQHIAKFCIRVWFPHWCSCDIKTAICAEVVETAKKRGNVRSEVTTMTLNIHTFFF